MGQEGRGAYGEPGETWILCQMMRELRACLVIAGLNPSMRGYAAIGPAIGRHAECAATNVCAQRHPTRTDQLNPMSLCAPM